MAKAPNYLDQSKEELEALALEFARDIFALKNELRVMRKLEKPHLLKETKRNRARVLTALRMKGEGFSASPAPKAAKPRKKKEAVEAVAAESPAPKKEKRPAKAAAPRKTTKVKG